MAWVWEDNGYAVIQSGNIEFHLDLQESFQPYRVHSYLFVENIDELYVRHKGKEIKIVSEIEQKSWGVREYTIRDINGHIFKIAQDNNSD